MEEDFLDLGFVDQSFLEDVKEVEDTQEEDKTTEKEKETKEETKETNKETETKQEETKKEVVENPKDAESEGSPNLSSSIARALADDGVLQTLDDEKINNIKDAESLIEAFREELRNQLDEKQKRIDDALTYGVEPTKIQQYEQWIKTLDEVTDDILEAEGDKSENYRKNLIYQNYLVKGFDEEEAKDMVNRSVESGNDMNDAKKALNSLKNYYKKAYDDEIADAKKQYDKNVAEQKKQYENLKASILEDKENFYEQFEVGKAIRQKIFDTVSKPSVVIGKDKDGKDIKITQLQKFIKDDPNKANKIIGTLYVITEGFTKFDGILKGTVKKQVRESVKNLERALNNTKPIDGSLSLKTGVSENNNLKIIDFDFED